MFDLSYCKRHRMKIDLAWIEPEPPLPAGFHWQPWSDDAVRTHADVIWRSFRGELDAMVFPNLSRREACLQLMRVIRDMECFMPDATWLIDGPGGCCGSIQGIRQEVGLGMIQNIGVLQDYRGIGLGRALLLKALHGFRNAQLHEASLEVSARNRRAVGLYHRIGFIVDKTFYREFTRAKEEIYVI
jgi:GNAT superfamily N-acetyltransferase